MAGHVIALTLLKAGHEVDVVARKGTIFAHTIELDVRDFSALDGLVLRNGYDVVVNCVGMLIAASNARPAEAVLINAYLPQHLASTLGGTSTRLLHLSTDCVFSGDQGPYAEDAPYDGQRVYDRSKALGEVVNDKDLTLRMSIIGPELTADGSGLFGWFMRQHGTIRGYSRAMWNGVTTMELARSVEVLARTQAHGLVHLVPDESVSKFELLTRLNGEFARHLSIEPDAAQAVDKRLCATRQGWGLRVRSYDQQLRQLHAWVEERADLYPYYEAPAR